MNPYLEAHHAKYFRDRILETLRKPPALVELKQVELRKKHTIRALAGGQSIRGKKHTIRALADGQSFRGKK